MPLACQKMPLGCQKVTPINYCSGFTLDSHNNRGQPHVFTYQLIAFK